MALIRSTSIAAPPATLIGSSRAKSPPGLTADQVYFDFSGVAYLPAMMIGVTLGMLFFNRLNDRQFALVVNLLLIVSGLSFLV